jgi:AcrR family transcriptional regulator
LNMPKAPMTKEEIESTRERILETALKVIIEEGFNNLSLRKIASRLGVTATTIYHYYTNKDEINLMIRIRGFEKLHSLLIKRSEHRDGIEEKFKAMILAYIEFGLNNPSYYDIMFNLHTPKYLDYVGTEIETLANTEKQNALKCLTLFMNPLNEYLQAKDVNNEPFILRQVIKMWSDLHGLITLNNSRLFHEVIDNVEDLIKDRSSDMIDNMMKLKESLDQEK